MRSIASPPPLAGDGRKERVAVPELLSLLHQWPAATTAPQEQAGRPEPSACLARCDLAGRHFLQSAVPIMRRSSLPQASLMSRSSRLGGALGERRRSRNECRRFSLAEQPVEESPKRDHRRQTRRTDQRKTNTCVDRTPRTQLNILYNIMFATVLLPDQNNMTKSARCRAIYSPIDLLNWSASLLPAPILSAAAQYPFVHTVLLRQIRYVVVEYDGQSMEGM